MGIDPTFNLGDFSVTPIVYQHLLVENSSGGSPWMMGLILMHYRKGFRNYNCFLSSLIGLKHTLANIRAVGTDSERALIAAISQQFRGALQLRCFRHIQADIERHLHEKKYPSSVIKQYIQDIFGADNSEGSYVLARIGRLCYWEEFNEQLETLRPVWEKREENAGLEATFYSWLKQFKAPEFCNSTLRGIREKAGLGSPPLPYFTNSNEAMNRVIKEKVQ